MNSPLLVWHNGYGYIRATKEGYVFTGKQEEATGYANRKVAEAACRSLGIDPNDCSFRYRK